MVTQAGIAGGNPALPIAGSRGRRSGRADAFGWGGLALVVLIGARTSGFSGAVTMLGLFALVVGVLALARGRVGWARLGSRAAGGAALGSALALIAVGAVAAPPKPPPPVKAVASATAFAPPTSTPAPATTRPDLATLAAPTVATTVAAPVATATPATARPDLATLPVPTVATTVAAPVATATPIAPVVAVAQGRHGSALAAVAGLTVKGRAPKTGYARAQFGQSWFDTDRNGCDTRNDMLRRDLSSRQMKNACLVLAGTLAPDPYTGTLVRFVYGGASEVDIDHVVALSDAWQKGAARWSAEKRLAFANDPLNLLAVDASANRSKGDGDAATWLPANKSYRCTYVARQVAVKGKFGVWVTPAERDAMSRVLGACPSMPLPGPGTASTVVALPRVSTPMAPAKAPAPAPAPRPAPAPPPSSVYYANCTAAREAGAAPIMRGKPGYASKLDRDNDGIACE